MRRAVSALALAGCLSCQTTAPAPEAPLPPPVAARPVPPPAAAADARFALVPWSKAPQLVDDGEAASLLAALAQSRVWARRQPETRQLTLAGRTIGVRQLDDALAEAERLVQRHGTGPELTRALATVFDLYESRAATEAPVLYTGYYVPLVEGSFVPDPAYKVPVYGVPDDLVTISLEEFDSELKGRRLRGRLDGRRLVPYWERAQIRAGALAPGKAPVVAWVKDELDLFVVEIQGSGILRDKSGRQRVIGYAGENGRPYRAIGSLLLREGKIPREAMSMQAIKAYLRANPKELARVLSYNPSFVFFQMNDKDALGNLGVPVTPERSIATDQRHVPPGVLAFVAVDRPARAKTGAVTSAGTIRRFVLNQDTGGAIRGPARVDFFWGAGEKAAEMAGAMQHKGRLFVLVPKAGGGALAQGE